MATTKIITMTGYVEYARVFEENMDDNADFNRSEERSVGKERRPRRWRHCNNNK